MDTQPLSPASSGPFSTIPSGGGGRSPLMLALLVILGLGTLIFGILTVTFSSKATSVQKTASAKQAAAVSLAREDQKKIDDAANARANESPFRTYAAPTRFGSFVINFPKDWSSYVDEQPTGTQVTLILNPEFIRRTDGKDAPVAVKVSLFDTPKDRYLTQFNGAIKSNKIKKSDTTVAGQPAFELAGTFPDRRTVREIYVPIRDKVLVFATEDAKFEPEFRQVIAQSKIIP